VNTLSVILNAFPALSWILLLVLWFGVFSPLPILLTITLTTLPILLPLATNPLKLNRILDLASLVKASSLRTFRWIILPSYFYLIISYIRAGLGFSVKMSMVAEAFTVSEGLGSKMMLAYSLGNFSQLLYLSLVSVTLALVLDLLGRKLWKLVLS